MEYNVQQEWCEHVMCCLSFIQTSKQLAFTISSMPVLFPYPPVPVALNNFSFQGTCR